MTCLLVPLLIRRSPPKKMRWKALTKEIEGGLEKELAGLGKKMDDYKDKERRRKPTKFKLDE